MKRSLTEQLLNKFFIMKNKKIILIVIAVALLATAGFFFFYNKPQQPQDVGNVLEKADLIVVTSPKSNNAITSPLIITGMARGYWFFEASFPIKLLDGKGNIIASGIAQSESDWMTENFVPFRAELKFENPGSGRGMLILEKDNPSDLPQNADELRMPIVFRTAGVETMAIKVFFNNSEMDPEVSCNKVFPVERIIPKTDATARAALEQLFSGPTEQEKLNGFFTSINPDVKIQKLTIENGIAKADFNDRLEFQVGGSCRVSAIRAQIIQTLKQFSTVQEVIISINGRTEDILQP